MPDKKYRTLICILLLAGGIFSGSGILPAADLSLEKENKEGSSGPILYLVRPEPNSTETVIANAGIIRDTNLQRAADANLAAQGRPNLVVVTHGWYETKPWPQDLAVAIKNQVDCNGWSFGWYDWRDEAKRLNPIDAARFGKDVGGPLLGEKIVALSKEWGHVHLIGHSAGSWVISEAAKIIAKETDATIHLTFLDAYVPPFWQEKELGGFVNEPNATGFCEHYFTKDLTLGATQKVLPWAHNVDLTRVNPGLKDHEFPRYWYHATVIGKYEAGQRYGGKKLFNKLDGMEYGFCRSLEADGENWKVSVKLDRGNKPVKIKRPKKPLKLWLLELFKKPK